MVTSETLSLLAQGAVCALQRNIGDAVLASVDTPLQGAGSKKSIGTAWRVFVQNFCANGGYGACSLTSP